MATDEKDPKPGASRTGGEPSDTGAMERFVDRDDDRSSAFIDSDYSEEFPDPGSDSSDDADPGYAAFASELEDPLADWPSPEVSIDELPEMRRRSEPDVAFGSSDPSAVQDKNEAGVSDDKRLRTDAIEDVLTPPSAGNMLFDDADDDGDLAPGPDVFDGDSLPPESYERGVATSVSAKAAKAAATSPIEPEIPDPPDELAVETDEPLAQSNDPFAVTADPSDEADGGLFDEQEETFEDGFVDDFLNDLDPPEADDYEVEDEEYSTAAADFEEDDISGGAAMAASSAVPASSVERATPYRSHDTNSGARSGAPASAADGDGGERSLPVAMIAVVLIALLLLGIGGYGVVKQRGQMQAEIRELQARLATTITPKEAEAERERQRQVQMENESLTAELEGLTAENSALAQQLAQIEATLADQKESEEQAQQAAEEARAAAARSAELAAARTASAPAASTGAAAPAGGPWFVNFGSYADRGIADRWAGKLSVDDGRVVVQSATAAGKTLYRVRVIGLNNQDAAERVATALERQYQLPRLWVGKS